MRKPDSLLELSDQVRVFPDRFALDGALGGAGVAVAVGDGVEVEVEVGVSVAVAVAVGRFVDVAVGAGVFVNVGDGVTPGAVMLVEVAARGAVACGGAVGGGTAPPGVCEGAEVAEEVALAVADGVVEAAAAGALVAVDVGVGSPAAASRCGLPPPAARQ